MRDDTKKGLEIIQTAALLGVLGDSLLRVTPLSLNFALWLMALIAATTALVFRHHNAKIRKTETFMLLGAATVFAFLFVWRDAALLKFFDFLAVMSLLTLLVFQIREIRLQTALIGEYLKRFLQAGASAAFAPFLLIFKDINLKKVSSDGNAKILAIVRGLLIAAPLIFIFGLLFVAADAVFQNIVQNTFHINGEQFFSHILLIGFLSWTTAGFLRFLVVYSPKVAEASTSPTPFTAVEAEISSVVQTSPNAKDSFIKIGIIEICIVLGLLNALFLSFVIVQLPYLFGGAQTVLQTADFGYAEYARRGFFELVTVTALNLLVLLATHWLLDKDKPSSEKIYRILAAVNISLLAVIMLSALNRMFLYQAEYGLTELRIYTTAFMLWLGFVLMWFAMTVLRGRRDLFMFGAYGTALVVILAMQIPNLQQMIVRINFERAAQQKPFDLHYLTRLDDDAIPELLEQISAQDWEKQCSVADAMKRRLQDGDYNDWRTWSWSRYRAAWVMDSYLQNHSGEVCPPKEDKILNKIGAR